MGYGIERASTWRARLSIEKPNTVAAALCSRPGQAEAAAPSRIASGIAFRESNLADFGARLQWKRCNWLGSARPAEQSLPVRFVEGVPAEPAELPVAAGARPGAGRAETRQAWGGGSGGGGGGNAANSTTLRLDANFQFHSPSGPSVPARPRARAPSSPAAFCLASVRVAGVGSGSLARPPDAKREIPKMAGRPTFGIQFAAPLAGCRPPHRNTFSAPLRLRATTQHKFALAKGMRAARFAIAKAARTRLRVLFKWGALHLAGRPAVRPPAQSARVAETVPRRRPNLRFGAKMRRIAQRRSRTTAHGLSLALIRSLARSGAQSTSDREREREESKRTRELAQRDAPATQREG